MMSEARNQTMHSPMLAQATRPARFSGVRRRNMNAVLSLEKRETRRKRASEAR